MFPLKLSKWINASLIAYNFPLSFGQCASAHPEQAFVDVMGDLFFGTPTVAINAVISPQIIIAVYNDPATTTEVRDDTKAIRYPLRISHYLYTALIID